MSYKHLLISLLLVGAVSAPFSARAQTSTATGTLRDQLQNRIEIRKDRLLNVRERASATRTTMEERRAQLTEERRARIRAFFERMFKRLRVAFERLEKLVERIESRIAKLEEVNKNIKTEDAKKYLVEARSEIEKGKTALAGLPALREELLADNADHATIFKKRTIFILD